MAPSWSCECFSFLCQITSCLQKESSTVNWCLIQGSTSDYQDTRSTLELQLQNACSVDPRSSAPSLSFCTAASFARCFLLTCKAVTSTQATRSVALLTGPPTVPSRPHASSLPRWHPRSFHSGCLSKLRLLFFWQSLDVISNARKCM